MNWRDAVGKRKPETKIKQAIEEFVVLSDRLRGLQQEAQTLAFEVGRAASELDRIVNKMERP